MKLKKLIHQKRNFITQMEISAYFDGLIIHLIDQNDKISDIGLTGLMLHFQQYAAYQSVHVHLSLNEIFINDCTSTSSLYTQVLQVLPSLEQQQLKKLIDITFDTYHPQEADYPQQAGQVIGHFQGLQTTFCMKFIDQMIQYFTTGPFIELANQLDEVEQQQLGEIEQQQRGEIEDEEEQQQSQKSMSSDFFAVNINLSNMLLLVPQKTLVKNIYKLKWKIFQLRMSLRRKK